MADKSKNPLLGVFHDPPTLAERPDAGQTAPQTPPDGKATGPAPGKPTDEKKPTEPPKAPPDGKATGPTLGKPTDEKKPTEPPKAPADGKTAGPAPGKPTDEKKPTEPPKAPADGKAAGPAPGKPTDEKKPTEPPKAPPDGKAAGPAPGKPADEKKPTEPPMASPDGKDSGSRTAEGPKGSTVTDIFPDRLDYPSDQDMHSLPVPKEGQVFGMAVHPAYLKDFLDHPFTVNRETDDYKELFESIRKYGITAPIECRIGRDGGLEIISGHRRHDIAVQLNYPIPVTIAVIDDDDAQIRCVDGNLHRKDIPLSELARAAQMKMDALKRKAGRRPKAEVLADALEGKAPPKRSDELVAEDMGMSRAQVQRVLTVNRLADPMKKLVDKKELPLDTAEQISHLKKEEQEVLADAIEKEGGKVPSKTEAVKLKEASKAGKLTNTEIQNAVAPTKREVNPPLKVTFNDDELRAYFPDKGTTVGTVKRTVFEALDLRKRALERQAAKEAAKKQTPAR